MDSVNLNRLAILINEHWSNFPSTSIQSIRYCAAFWCGPGGSMVEHLGVVVRQSEQQGRFLEATRDLKAGELVIEEPAVLLVVAHECLEDYCALCLRKLPSQGHLRCDETRQACFCTAECASAAELESGGPNLALRRVLTSVPWDKLNADECNQVRFMMHVLSTRRDSTCSTQTTEVGKKWDQFCKLHALPPDSCSHQRVWEVVKTLVDPDVSHDDVSLCLRKEAANSFGIMAPVGEHGERSIRGTGVYELTNMMNHSCMPTAARVEDPDRDGPNRTYMRVQMLQDVPAGEEVSISYFPMHLDLQTRQERCQQLYGFTCTCMRCKNDMQQEQGSAPASHASHVACDHNTEATKSSQGNTAAEEQLALETQYIELYLMKYICTEPDCFGTFVPQHSGQQGTEGDSRAGGMACNVCGHTRTEEDFTRDVEKLFNEPTD